MSVSSPTTASVKREDAEPVRGFSVVGFIQQLVGLLVPLPLLRLARPVLRGRFGDGIRTLFCVASLPFWFFMLVAIMGVVASRFAPSGGGPPPKMTLFGALKMAGMAVLGLALVQAVVGLILDWPFWRAFEAREAEPEPFQRGVRIRVSFQRTVFRLIGTLFVIGFSLLPLSVLLIALPAVSPTEAVLSDTVRPARNWFVRTGRRVLAGLAGAV